MLPPESNTSLSIVCADPMSTATHIPLTCGAPELYRVLRSPSITRDRASLGHGLAFEAVGVQFVRGDGVLPIEGVPPFVNALKSAIDHQLPEPPVFTTRMYLAVCGVKVATSTVFPVAMEATADQLLPSFDTSTRALGAKSAELLPASILTVSKVSGFPMSTCTHIPLVSDDPEL